MMSNIVLFTYPNISTKNTVTKLYRRRYILILSDLCDARHLKILILSCQSIVFINIYYVFFSLGYYDHRWRLDSLDIVDDKGMTVGQIYGDVQLQSDGVIENCTALRGDGKIEFQDVEERCDNPSSFPLYTLSFWLKYKEMNSQTIISVGKFLNITQSANAPDKEHISVEASTTKKKCVTSFFVPSQVWSHIIVSVNALKKTLLVYLDGSIVKNSSNFVCTDHNEVQSYENASLVSGGNGDVDFTLDDVRLLFDAPEMSETIKSFTQETG